MVSESNTDDRVVKVLVVDDETPIRNALSRLLSKRGWTVKDAASGSEALEKIQSFGPELMLLDIRMPGMTGVDVVSEALSLDPDLGILMLTAVSDATSATICMQRGAIDYLTKPIELSNLESALKRALKRRDTLLQTREMSEWLKEEVGRRTRELEIEQAKLRDLSTATLETLVNVLEAKNPFLAGHSARVAAFSATVASEMNLSDDEIETVRMAGRLHDLGMIGIREDVLNKEGKLTDEEYEHIKKHVTIGAEILSPLKHLGDVAVHVRAHHEHWNGSGYPDGLQGEDIPLGGRIICASEIYDALTTIRPYQEKLAPDEAIDRMGTLEGRVVDPQVMQAVAHSITQRKSLIFLEDDLPPLE